MLVSDFDFVMIQCMVKGLLIVGRLVVRSAIILVIKQIRFLLRGRPFNLLYNHRSNWTPLSHINIIHLMPVSLLV